jgi:hypothetical protein
MKKKLIRWNIADLRQRFHEINFPEYQREPTVWDREKKQRLIDSMVRGFDIAAMYFYRAGEADIDCIDGRQRLNAIMSFLGENEQYAPEDNGFPFHSTNEVFDDEQRFVEIEGACYSDEEFGPWRKLIESYELNIVEVSDVKEPEELNLLFLRLQLGSILNSGEKLNAMTGDMRDFVFEKFGRHPFFSSISIPYRRFARQQVAAQIACNLFSLRDFGGFARTRYLDLQLFFKRYKTLNVVDKKVAESMSATAQTAVEELSENAKILRNRAITVTFFLYVHELIEKKESEEIGRLVSFFGELLRRLRWQIPKGLEMDTEYYDLVRFQTDVTQASVERTAVSRRHEFIH